jgi:hypothetical protein
VPIDAFLKWYYRAHPVNATFIGVHDHDHRLPDYSESALAGMQSEIVSQRNGLRAQEGAPGPPAQTIDVQLALGALDLTAWELQSSHGPRANPCLYTGEAIFGTFALFLRPFAPLEARLAAATERMRAIGPFLKTARSTLGRAPRAWIERAIRECAAAAEFFGRDIDILIRDEGIEAGEFREAARAASAAFEEHRDALTSTALPAATDSYACGSPALERLISRGHFLPWNTGEVLAMAHDRVAAAESKLRAAAQAAGASSWQDALTRLAGTHASVDEYYARYTQLWEAAQAAAIEHGLVEWPDYPIRYVPQPPWARRAAPNLYFLFYRAPAAFDRLPVIDYLVTPVDSSMPPEEQARRLRATNDSVIKLNHVIHHGGLGHHVQNWYAYHVAESRIGRIAAIDCANRIALFCGGTMAEGWSCYAVDVMDEIRFLTPLERVAQAHTRLRIAVRALADVQLHTGAWSLDETAACYRDRAGMSPEASKAEAVKNTLFPGTALMYLTGTEQIHALRAEMVGRRGMSLRAFHERFLSFGSIPVSLIARAMRDGAGAAAKGESTSS